MFSRLTCLPILRKHSRVTTSIIWLNLKRQYNVNCLVAKKKCSAIVELPEVIESQPMSAREWNEIYKTKLICDIHHVMSSGAKTLAVSKILVIKKKQAESEIFMKELYAFVLIPCCHRSVPLHRFFSYLIFFFFVWLIFRHSPPRTIVVWWKLLRKQSCPQI